MLRHRRMSLVTPSPPQSGDEMSIFKDKQRDPRTLWAWIKGLLFDAPCPSHIRFPGKKSSWVCELQSGHAGQHKAFTETPSEISWGYGDDYFGHPFSRTSE